MRSSNNTAAQRSSHSIPDSVIFPSAPFPPVKRGRGPFKVRPSLPQNFPVSALFDPGRPAKLAAELVGDRAKGSGRDVGAWGDLRDARRCAGGRAGDRLREQRARARAPVAAPGVSSLRAACTVQSLA